MKTKINGMEIEGTPEEMKEFVKAGKYVKINPTIMDEEYSYTATKLKATKMIKNYNKKGKSRRHHPWLQEEIKIAKEMLAKGKSYANTARVLKRTPHGVRTQNKQFWRIGIRDYATPVNSKKAGPEYKTGKWTMTEKMTLIKERQNGATWQEISKLLGRKNKTIQVMHSWLKKRKGLKSLFTDDKVQVGEDTSMPKKFSMMG